MSLIGLLIFVVVLALSLGVSAIFRGRVDALNVRQRVLLATAGWIGTVLIGIYAVRRDPMPKFAAEVFAVTVVAALASFAPLSQQTSNREHR
jgi:hypothetical protein